MAGPSPTILYCKDFLEATKKGSNVSVIKKWNKPKPNIYRLMGKKHQFEGFHCLGKVISHESSITGRHLTLRRQMKKKNFISVHQCSKAF
jgi:hypothetical protein